MPINNNYQFFQTKIAGQNNQIHDYFPSFDESGDFQRIDGINVIIQSIRTLLMTPLGKYPFDPEFGSLLYKQLFEMSDNITYNTIRNEVTTRIKRYDNRVVIDEVVVEFSPDKKTANVSVFINRNGVTGTIDVVLSAQNTMFGLEDEITKACNE